MQSTLSLTLDITQKKGFFTDTTDYSAISVDVNALGATGSVAIYFQGDLIGSPLTIDLAGGDTTTPLFDLELDLNGNVANGSYSAVYTVDFAFSNFTALSAPNQIVLASIGANYQGFTVGAEIQVSVDLPGGALITGASNVSGNLYVTIDESVSSTGGSPRAINVSQVFSGFSWVYSGCTQTTADVEFTYDCEYGNSGSWAVSNTTVLAANEFIASQSCTINYPSWTNVDPIFNPQVVITSLPYPTTLVEETPLATGTYSVLLSQQIQQNQASGLIVTYSNSITREFTVTCAGTLCGLVPCIENLRAAHAAELIRNKVSKYQVFVDNVALYYLEAMNYKACGELDKYKETINLLQAQLDASGCDCACCDDETYYWVSNNSANSIIDELLANFQYRLFDTGSGDPGSTQPGVEYGAIWQNTNTGVLYRCIDDTPSSLDWEVYYDPSEIIQAIDVAATATAPLTATNVQGQLNEIAADFIYDGANGINKTGTNLELGGALNQNTTIDLGFRTLDFTSTSGNLEFVATNGGNMIVSTNAGTAIDVTGTSSALKVEGTSNSLDVTATNTTAGILKVQRATDDTVAVNLALQTSVDSAPGANGLGSSVQFASEGATSSIITTGSIQSVLTSASAPTEGNLKFNTKSASGLINSFTLNPDGSATLHSYGGGTITGTAAQSLSVDSSGNVIETVLPKVYLALVTQSGTGNPTVTVVQNTTGETVTWDYVSVGTYNAIITGGLFAAGKTVVTASLGGYATFAYNGALVSVAGQRTSNSNVQILSFGAPTGGTGPELANGILTAATIRIEIYP